MDLLERKAPNNHHPIRGWSKLVELFGLVIAESWKDFRARLPYINIKANSSSLTRRNSSLTTFPSFELKRIQSGFKMSYLFGAGRPQPSSAEKIAAAETEVELVSDMFNRSVRIVLYYVPCSVELSLQCLKLPFASFVSSGIACHTANTDVANVID